MNFKSILKTSALASAVLLGATSCSDEEDLTTTNDLLAVENDNYQYQNVGTTTLDYTGYVSGVTQEKETISFNVSNKESNTYSTSTQNDSYTIPSYYTDEDVYVEERKVNFSYLVQSWNVHMFTDNISSKEKENERSSITVSITKYSNLQGASSDDLFKYFGGDSDLKTNLVTNIGKELVNVSYSLRLEKDNGFSVYEANGSVATDYTDYSEYTTPYSPYKVSINGFSYDESSKSIMFSLVTANENVEVLKYSEVKTQPVLSISVDTKITRQNFGYSSRTK